MSIALVEDWKKCYKWLSVQLATLAGFALVLYDLLPALQAAMPPKTFNYVQLSFLGLIIVGRLLKQGQANVPAQ